MASKQKSRSPSGKRASKLTTVTATEVSYLCCVMVSYELLAALLQNSTVRVCLPISGVI